MVGQRGYGILQHVLKIDKITYGMNVTGCTEVYTHKTENLPPSWSIESLTECRLIECAFYYMAKYRGTVEYWDEERHRHREHGHGFWCHRLPLFPSPLSWCSVEWHVQVQDYEPWLRYVYTMYSSPVTLLPLCEILRIHSVFPTIKVDRSKTV